MSIKRGELRLDLDIFISMVKRHFPEEKYVDL